MLSVNASLQTGLQLILAASSTNDSTSGSAIGSSDGSSTLKNGTAATGTTTANSTTQGNAGAPNSADDYSSASTIATLKAIQSTTSGPTAGVMTAIINSISSNNDYYGNIAEADNAAAKANDKLTSQDISSTLLGGGSLVQGVISGAGGKIETNTVSLKDILNSLSDAISAEKNNVDLLSNWVADGMPSNQPTYGKSSLASMTPDQVQKIINADKKDIANQEWSYKCITSALTGGSLKIQRATDVGGLNYVDSKSQSHELSGKNGYSRDSIHGISYNALFLEKNSNSGFLMSIGDVGIYLSW